MRFFPLLLTLPLFANPTVISSDAARYDGQTIILKGSVHVEHEMGELFAAHATLMRDEDKQSKLDFPWIKLEGDVRFCLPKERTLQCRFARCDAIEKKAYIEGGLHYSDSHGELFAHRGIIDYSDEDKLRPTKVTLLGQVQMSQEQQTALADEVEYFPDDELLIMTAKNNVLFYDHERGFELAAKEVRAKRDEEGQESVQGVGDVRFVFSAEELEKMRGVHAKNRPD
ncbi:MAG: hypothetical protein S4CHLAM81_09480 [Chlamydiales bacterium]|nr:hypothetical protein [Chlamydiales bacterium]